MSRERIIKKITVQTGGLKGLVLEGSVESVKENKVVINGFKDTVRHPIHRELEEKIGELRFFALDICGLIIDETPKAEKETLLGGCEVISMEFEKGLLGYIKIKVSSRVFDTKTITLTTPKTDSSDGYKWFETIMNIVDSLLEEVDQYAKGLKKITDEDLMISFIKHSKSKDLDIEALEAMEPEAKADWLQERLEKMGCMVIRPNQVYEEGEVEEVNFGQEPLMLDVANPSEDDIKSIEEVMAFDTMESGEVISQEDIYSDVDITPLKMPQPIKLKK